LKTEITVTVATAVITTTSTIDSAVTGVGAITFFDNTVEVTNSVVIDIILFMIFHDFNTGCHEGKVGCRLPKFAFVFKGGVKTATWTVAGYVTVVTATTTTGLQRLIRYRGRCTAAAGSCLRFCCCHGLMARWRRQH
jgi:hypothetical protein